MPKQVSCTHCGGALEVARSAVSGSCPHCHKRVVLEDLRIRTYHAVRQYATTGDIFVEKRGRLVAQVKAFNLTVNGEVRGSVLARGLVRIGKSGALLGDIEAPVLKVENGAALHGFLRIGPQVVEVAKPKPKPVQRKPRGTSRVRSTAKRAAAS